MGFVYESVETIFSFPFSMIFLKYIFFKAGLFCNELIVIASFHHEKFPPHYI